MIEAAIIVASDGELCNTWVATCASDACGYLGRHLALAELVKSSPINIQHLWLLYMLIQTQRSNSSCGEVSAEG